MKKSQRQAVTEIEITPEMVEAGLQALKRNGWGETADWSVPTEQTLREVFRAMQTQSPTHQS